MVEGDCRDEVVADVGADDVVEEVGVDEAEVAVDCCCGSAGEGPGFVVVVRHACVGVLEEGNCYCLTESSLVSYSLSRIGDGGEKRDGPIQLLTHNQGTPQSTITFQLPNTCPASTSAAIITATPTSLSRMSPSSLFL